MDEKGLGQRLQHMRKAAGLTQQDLCHTAGLSYSTLAKIERGAIKAPSIFTIQSIASALGIGLDELLGAAPLSAKAQLHSGAPALRKRVAQNGARFVYFDVNGCLVRFFNGAFMRLAADAHVRADEVENLFWHYNDDVCRGQMSLRDFNDSMAKALGISTVDWMQYYMESVEPVMVMHQMVEWAAERYRVGLITNIMPGFVQELQRRKLVPAVQFDAIIDSSQVGAIKPERKIFEVATTHAALPPSEIMLVDDDRTNVVAAERFGWQVMRFDDYQADDSIQRLRQALEPLEG
jgi:FMN phosphatase YigB (HAD superfamily)/transcriptional regulator with XRE-family HTH domain